MECNSVVYHPRLRWIEHRKSHRREVLRLSCDDDIRARTTGAVSLATKKERMGLARGYCQWWLRTTAPASPFSRSG